MAGVYGPFAAVVGGAAGGFFDDNSVGREIPGLRGPVQSSLNRAFGDEHVLPESAERPAVARGVEQPADFRLVGCILAWPGSGGEHHGVAKLVHVRNVKSFSVAIGAFPSISPPARAQTGCADQGGDDFAAFLDGHERPKSWNAAR